MFYGLSSIHSAVAHAVAVCDVLGHGNLGNAALLLTETAAAETFLGEYRDPTERYAGAGLTQVDEGTFDWLKDKFSNTKDEKALHEAFGFTLSDVVYSELELSPLLAFVFARLRYRVVPDSIPATLEGRAEYWKVHYNSSAGAGTIDDYLRKSKQFVPTAIFPDFMKVDY